MTGSPLERIVPVVAGAAVPSALLAVRRLTLGGWRDDEPGDEELPDSDAPRPLLVKIDLEDGSAGPPAAS